MTTLKKILFGLPTVILAGFLLFGTSADAQSLGPPINYSAAATGSGGGGGGTPGGSSGQVQFNAAGSFGGIVGATTDGTTLTLVAPVLGTPASGTLTNATGLPISTGVSGLGANIATWLGTPSSANLAAALTDKTGTGLVVLSTSPSLITPALGIATASSLALNGCTLSANTLCASGTTSLATLLASGAITGSSTIAAGASSTVGFTGRTLISSPSDGVLALENNAGTDFGRLQLGGTTSSFPALKRSTTTVQVRLADDSGYSTLGLASLIYNGSSSGAITIQPQAAAGTYNFNLPTTAGTAGQLLTSQGGGASAMTWTNAGTGTVTSVATGAGLTGGAITTTGTLSLTEVLGNGGAAITGTTYTINTSTDAATDLLFTGSSGSAWTLGTAVSGVGFDVINQGTASVTITATGNINGAATLVITAGQWAHVFAMSTSTWYAEVPGSGGGSSAITIGTTTITSGTSGRFLFDNAGVVGETATTGSGNVVLATSPTLVTPALGTPTSIVLTSATGLPLTTGVTGILPIANGGTNCSAGAVSCLTAVGGLTGSPSSSNFLRGDGTWNAPAAVAAPTYTSNRWYISNPSTNTTSGSAFSSGTIYWRLFYQTNAVTLQAVGGRITTAAAGGHCQIAIYATNSTGFPTGSNLAHTADIATDTAQMVSGTLSLALSANTLYAAGFFCDNTTVGWTAGSTGADLTNGYWAGSATLANLSGNATNWHSDFVTTSASYSTWPSNPTISEGNTPTAARTPILVFEAA